MERQEKRIFSFKGMQVTLRKAAYRFGNTLAVIMDEVESGDEYGTITVNLSHDIQDGYAAFVDTNNIPGIDTWLAEQGIARNTGILGRSGFCTYPLMLFDTDRF